MISKYLIAIVTAFLSLSQAYAQNGEAIVKKMYDRYAKTWYRALTFDQTTEIYRNDSLFRTQQWHEAMLFPDKLRIDIEPLEKSNTIIFRSDSTYSIRGGKVARADKEGNDLIFLLGGMYFHPYDKTIATLKALGYDLTKSGEGTFNGKPIYIIGATNQQDHNSQLWVDKENLCLLRMIKYGGKEKEDGIFSNWIKIDGGYAETRVDFYVNDKLIQVEKYSNCKTPATIDEHIYDPNNYVKFSPAQ